MTKYVIKHCSLVKKAHTYFFVLIVAGKDFSYFKIIFNFFLGHAQCLVDVGFAHLKIKFRRHD
jgi:hypothetical protein